MLKRHWLYEAFDLISGADAYSINKSERCRKAANQMNIESEKVILVGDAESDILLANELGYGSCFVDTEISWYKDKEYIMNVLHPTYTVHNLKDIPLTIWGQ